VTAVRPREMVFVALLVGLAVVVVRGQDGPGAVPMGAPNTAVRAAIARAAPSVVRVDVDGRRPRGDAPRWRFFREIPARQEGSGFVVDERLIVTHASLALYEAPSFTVTTPRGIEHPAELVHLDLEREVAVLRTSQRLGLTPVVLAGTAALRPGSMVIALGDPFGTARDSRPAASLGILEGRLRLDAREVSYTGGVLVTDAAINPGNEGGPLIDLEGRVVGLLAPLARDRRTGTLVGHALPAEVVVASLAEMRDGPGLGFSARDLPDGAGVQVVEVYPGTPAHRAGLRSGDLLRVAQGLDVSSLADLRVVLARAEGTLRLEVDRHGTRRSLTLERRP
jgi:S1-C subfamily serine protease